jgi:hypothetical protein
LRLLRCQIPGQVGQMSVQVGLIELPQDCAPR